MDTPEVNGFRFSVFSEEHDIVGGPHRLLDVALRFPHTLGELTFLSVIKPELYFFVGDVFLSKRLPRVLA